MTPGGGWHPMPKGDGRFLAGLLAVSVAAFLIPPLRTAKFAGVALFGWWMAALMFLGPLTALIRMKK